MTPKRPATGSTKPKRRTTSEAATRNDPSDRNGREREQDGNKAIGPRFQPSFPVNPWATKVRLEITVNAGGASSRPLSPRRGTKDRAGSQMAGPTRRQAEDRFR